jgi:hypothetical protein
MRRKGEMRRSRMRRKRRYIVVYLLKARTVEGEK